MEPIKFGASGWQGVLGDTFTYPRVRIVTQGIAQYLRQEKIGQRGVIVGHDSRFLGEQFAKIVAEVLAAHGIPSMVCDGETPTPVISFHVLRHQLAGGITISASHNSPEWNGIKFTPSWGGPALPETTQVIEQRILPLLHGEFVKWLPWEKGAGNGLIRSFDPKPDYLTGLERHVDVEVIRQGNLRVVMDPFYGTSRGYLDAFLRKAGAKMAVLHYWRDPYFGGRRPEPTPETTADLQETVIREQAHLGLATDADSDRFGIVDQNGVFVEANHLLALLVDYLAKTRGWKGTIARSVATTHLIDQVAGYHGLEVRETPVGFKFLAQLLANGEIFMGVEESAGLSITGHVPERDGILACLLVAEMIARTGTNLGELVEDLFRRVGAAYSRRQDLISSDGMRSHLSRILENPPDSLGRTRVKEVNTLDGCKLLLEDGSWFLVRSSETESFIRCYGEASTPDRLCEVMKDGQMLLNHHR